MSDKEVFTVNYWTKGKGKERAYITLNEKLNGGQDWNNGVGWEGYVDLYSGDVVTTRDWAGGATRDKYIQKLDNLTSAIFATSNYRRKSKKK